MTPQGNSVEPSRLPSPPPTEFAHDHCAKPTWILRRGRAFAVAAISVLLLFFAVMSFSAVLTKSATYDEPLHAIGAWAHLHRGDFRIDFEDPPLWQYWASIPNGRDSIQFNDKDPNWLVMPADVYKEWPFSTNTLYRTAGNDGRQFVNRSRFMMMLLGVALGALIAAWTWKLAGPLAACIATALFASDPNLLAHASLVKNDVPMALMLTAVVFVCWQVGRRLTIANAMLLALLVAAAVETKFSALLLGPIIAVTLGMRACLPLPWLVPGRTLTSFFPRLATVGFVLILISGVSFIGAWAVYGFRFDPSPNPAVALDTWAIEDQLVRERFVAQNRLPSAEPFDSRIAPTDRVRTFARNLDEFSRQLKEYAATIHESRAPERYRKEREQDAAQLSRTESRFILARQSAQAFLEKLSPSVLHATADSEQLLAMSKSIYDADSALRLAQYYVRYNTASARGIAGSDRLVSILEFMLDHRLMPSAWIHGVLFVHSREIARGSFLMGDIRTTGWWYYFPLAMLFKMPMATILALIGTIVAGIWFVIGRHGDWRRFVWPLSCMLASFALYMAFAMTSHLNIGVRHVLPVYSLMYITAGAMIAWAIRHGRRILIVGAATVGLILLTETTVAWPNYIAFFGFPFRLGGGGIRLLSNSNLDWGQDLPLLAQWQHDHPDTPLAFGPEFSYARGLNPIAGNNDVGDYFGSAAPEFYGIRSDPFPVLSEGQADPASLDLARSHVLAISATLLQGTYTDYFARFRHEKPMAVLGDTIYLFDYR